MDKSSSPRKLVILDFCETLIKFQTADRFIDFVCEDKNVVVHKIILRIEVFLKKVKFTSIVHKISPKFNINKRLRLLSIIGINKNHLSIKAESYSMILMDNMIPEMRVVLNESLRNDDYVILVSGGYELYLLEFAKYFNIKDVIGTKLMFKNNRATGLFSGLDCMHGNKTILLESYIEKNDIKYNESVVYSDSISDLPLLAWADKGWVISKGNSQDWVKSHNLNELVWNE